MFERHRDAFEGSRGWHRRLPYCIGSLVTLQPLLVLRWFLGSNQWLHRRQHAVAVQADQREINVSCFVPKLHLVDWEVVSQEWSLAEKIRVAELQMKQRGCRTAALRTWVNQRCSPSVSCGSCA